MLKKNENAQDILITLFKDLRIHHTDFQIDHFILKDTTLFGKYFTALRELHGRFQAIQAKHIKIERAKLEIKKLKWKIENSSYDNPVDKEIDEFEYQLKINSIQDRSLLETKNEFIRFLKHAIYLKNEIEKVPENNRKRLEEEYWRNHFIGILAGDIINYGKLTSASYQSLHQLPQKIKTEIFEILKSQKGLSGIIEEFDKIQNKPSYSEEIDIENVKIPEIDFEKIYLLPVEELKSVSEIASH